MTSRKSLFGINLAAANEDVWRRHRRVMGPAFNSKLFVGPTLRQMTLELTCYERYNLVWDQSIKTYRDMIQNEPGWTGKTVTLKYKLDTYQGKGTGQISCYGGADDSLTVFTRAKSFNRWISTKKEDLFAVRPDFVCATGSRLT